MSKVIKKLGLSIAILSMILIIKPCIEAKATSEYTYIVDNNTDEVTITGYTGSDTELTIPNNIDGHKVTAIGEDAFYLKKTLTSITLPNTIENLYWRALYGTSITDLTLPLSVSHVYLNAIAGNVNLQTVTVLSSTTQIDEEDRNEAFFGSNKKLLKVYCKPNSYTSELAQIAGYQFYYLDEYSPSSIEFTTSTITVNVGDTYNFTNGCFQVLPTTAYVITPTSYQSSNNDIAYVSSDGILTAKKVGTVTINATISDEHLENSVTTTSPITVNVVENRKAVESVSLNIEEEKTVYVGDTFQLSSTVFPTDATYTSRYYNENSNIITISDSGMVTAIAEGTTYIGIEAISKYGNTNVTKGGYCLVHIEKATTPTTPITPDNPGTSDTTDTTNKTDTTDNTNSTDSNITISQTTEEVKVKKGKITLNASKIRLQKGKTIKTLKLKTNELEGDNIVRVTSSNKKVLKAYLRGHTIVLKGIKKYKKYVTVKVTMSSGATATCKVKVVRSKIKTKKLILSNKKITIRKGKTQKLTVTRNPISATDKITYKSSNKKVATVNKKGKIKAKRRGKATITVTSASGKKAKCKVIVN